MVFDAPGTQAQSQLRNGFLELEPYREYSTPPHLFPTLHPPVPSSILIATRDPRDRRASTTRAPRRALSVRIARRSALTDEGLKDAPCLGCRRDRDPRGTGGGRTREGKAEAGEVQIAPRSWRGRSWRSGFPTFFFEYGRAHKLRWSKNAFDWVSLFWGLLKAGEELGLPTIGTGPAPTWMGFGGPHIQGLQGTYLDACACGSSAGLRGSAGAGLSSADSSRSLAGCPRKGTNKLKLLHPGKATISVRRVRKHSRKMDPYQL